MSFNTAVLLLLISSVLTNVIAGKRNEESKKQLGSDIKTDKNQPHQKRGLYGYEASDILGAPPLPHFSSISSAAPLVEISSASPIFKSSIQPEIIIKSSPSAIVHDELHPTPLPHIEPANPHVKEVTVTKEVPVPYYIHVEKKVPYPVYVRVPHPYPVTVEKHVPYGVPVERHIPVPVPKPYPVTVEKHIAVPVEKRVPYPVKVPVDRPYPVHVPVEKPVPYAVEKPVPYPVLVDRPIAVPKPYPVTVEKRIPVPVPVEKHYSYIPEIAVKSLPYKYTSLTNYDNFHY